MLEQPLYRYDDIADIRSLIRGHAWVSLTSWVPDAGLVVSHLPVVLDPDRHDVAILGHLAKTDAERHQLGEHEIVIVVEGPNGYLSPTFYQAEPYVPTWNFVVAHLHGRPALLGPDETYGVLERTVEHFESQRPTPWPLSTVEEYGHRIAPHTTGFRLIPSRVVGKAKLSQEKPVEVARRVVRALERDEDVHHNHDLAAAMRRALTSRHLPPH